MSRMTTSGSRCRHSCSAVGPSARRAASKPGLAQVGGQHARTRSGRPRRPAPWRPRSERRRPCAERRPGRAGRAGVSSRQRRRHPTGGRHLASQHGAGRGLWHRPGRRSTWCCPASTRRRRCRGCCPGCRPGPGRSSSTTAPPTGPPARRGRSARRSCRRRRGYGAACHAGLQAATAPRSSRSWTATPPSTPRELRAAVAPVAATGPHLAARPAGRRGPGGLAMAPPGGQPRCGPAAAPPYRAVAERHRADAGGAPRGAARAADPRPALRATRWRRSLRAAEAGWRVTEVDTPYAPARAGPRSPARRSGRPAPCAT